MKTVHGPEFYNNNKRPRTNDWHKGRRDDSNGGGGTNNSNGQVNTSYTVLEYTVHIEHYCLFFYSRIL